MTDDKIDADQSRIARARELLVLFERVRGRPLKTTEELYTWLHTADGEAATRDFDAEGTRRYLVAQANKLSALFERARGLSDAVLQIEHRLP